MTCTEGAIFGSLHWRRCHGARHRRGFSFAEVMFAVIILGVGFIMIAGIFPVAIQQNQTTNEESEAAAAAREAANTIANIAQQGSPAGMVVNNATEAMQFTSPNGPVASVTPLATVPMFPPTVKQHTSLPTVPVANLVAPPAIVVPFGGARWQAIQNSVILASDPRYAYVPFYKRENNSNVAELIVVAVAVRNRPIYQSSEDVGFARTTGLPLGVSPNASISVHIYANNTAGTGPDNQTTPYMTIVPNTIRTSTTCVEGGFVTFPMNVAGTPQGRTYCLGRALGGASGTLFEIEPGDDLSEGPGADGLWGTGDDEYDTPVSGAAAIYAPPATLQPVVVYASVYSFPGSLGGRITLSQSNVYPSSGGTNVAPPAAAPGAFVIVSDDYSYDSKQSGVTPYTLPQNDPIPTKDGFPSSYPAWTVGALNGRIFRLGAAVPANPNGTPPVYPGTYELDSAYGMRPGVNGGLSPDTIPNPSIPAIPNNTNPAPWARCFMIGAGRTDPTAVYNAATYSNASNYSGAAQDVSVYTTFIPVQ